jgi:hypothetical protein
LTSNRKFHLEGREPGGSLRYSVGIASGSKEISVELLEDSFAGMGDGIAPEVGFPVVMERGAWGESHHSASASSEDHGWFFGFPAIGAAIRATVIGLVKVLGSLADFDDIGEGLLVKVPVGIRVELAIRIWVTNHGLLGCGRLALLSLPGDVLFGGPAFSILCADYTGLKGGRVIPPAPWGY